MSKNINISITLKELTVLEYLVDKKHVKPTDGISAMVLLEEINAFISSTHEGNPPQEEIISRTVLYRMLKKFRDNEIIADGIKIGKIKMLYITPKGVQFYASLVGLSQESTTQLLEAYEQINGKWNTAFENKVR